MTASAALSLRKINNTCSSDMLMETSPFTGPTEVAYQSFSDNASMTNNITVYFGYGSNLWLDQMRRRCPDSKYIGVASLSDW